MAESWVSKAPFPVANRHGKSGVLNKQIYVLGFSTTSTQQTVYVYDPSTDTWTTKANYPIVMDSFSVGVSKGLLYTFGGFYNQQSVGYVYSYDPTTNQWMGYGGSSGMITGRYDSSAAVLNNLIYVIGGYITGSGNSNLNECFDTLTTSWTSKANLQTVRDVPISQAISGKIYTFGGYNGSTYLNTIEIYDPVANSWTYGTAAAVASGYGANGIVDGLLYVVGGYNGTATVTSSNAYDPITNTWTSKLADPAIPRDMAEYGVVDGKLYVIAGADKNYNNLTTNNAYSSGVTYATPTLVQNVNGSSGASPMTATLPSSVTAGNTIIVFITVTHGIPSSPTVTDNLGNSYALDFSTTAGGGPNQYVFSAHNIKAGSTTITFTGAGGSSYTMIVTEWSGIAPSAIDSSFTKNEYSATSITFSPEYITTTFGNDLLIDFVSDDGWGSGTYGATSGGWQQVNAGIGAYFNYYASDTWVEYLNVTTASSYTAQPQFLKNNTTGTDFQRSIIAYKAATAGAPPPSPPLATLVSVDHYKISNQSGENFTDVTFNFNQDIQQWRINLLGTAPTQGTLLATGGVVSANSNILSTINYSQLSGNSDGTYQINIYGSGNNGWTPYMET